MRNGCPALRVCSVLVLLTLTACDQPTQVQPDRSWLSDVAVQDARLTDALRAIQSTTARFHSVEQAQRAGYAATHDCVAVPALGGMGYHWPNFGLVDPVFDPLQPEALLYEPGPNGKLKLVAVEYIVVDVGQPRPELDGHPFDIGGTPVPVAHWSLHVWVHKHNPNGVFTPFNPDVSCS